MPANVRFSEASMDSDTLTTKQEQLVELLLSGNSIVAASRQLHVNEKTCRRWLKLPHVQTELRSARRRLYESKMSVLLEGVSTALKTLLVGMDPEKTRSEFVRMSSAAKWLDLTAQVIVDAAHDERMAQAELLLEEIKERLPIAPKLRRTS